MHKKRSPSTKRLTLHRETLRTLDRTILEKVVGGAPTRGLACGDFSNPSLCATCLCTV